MKERVLLQGTVSEVFFPNKGKVIPTVDQPPLPEADFLNEIRYKAPSEPHGPFYVKNVLPMVSCNSFIVSGFTFKL